MGVIPIHPPGALPEPATPALAGVEWWTGREGAPGRAAVLEHQRKMDAVTIAQRDAVIDRLYALVERQNDTIDRLRGDLAQAGLALDALTALARVARGDEGE